MKKHHLLGVILLCSGLFSCSSGVIQQANYEVIPLPQEIKITTGNFVLNVRYSSPEAYPTLHHLEPHRLQFSLVSFEEKI